MSSIFKLEYIQNLNRINAKAASSERVERKSSTFAQVLADIEKRDQLSKQSDLLEKERLAQNAAGLSNGTDGILSNFKQQDLKISNDGVAYVPKVEVEKQADLVLSSVKSPAIPVKITPALGQIDSNPTPMEVRSVPTAITNKAIKAFSKF